MRSAPAPKRTSWSGAVKASATASVVDVTTLMALLFLGLCAPGPAAAMGCLAGGVVSFHATRRWAFGCTAKGTLEEGAAYGALVVGGGALWCGVLVHLATGAGWPALGAKAVAAAVVWLAWNLPVSRALFAPRPAA